MANNLFTMANAINTLSDYLGVRDVAQLMPANLKAKYGFKQADLCILYGGSILAGGDVLACAIKNHVAKHYIISGGNGHTTPLLRNKMKEVLSRTGLQGLSEAEMFQQYLEKKYHLQADFLETKSTNCGNNVTNVLSLAKEEQLATRSIIVMQDATMQKRMYAVFLKESPDSQIINYATYQNHVAVKANRLVFTRQPVGMWTVDHFVQLLMGEVPRLTDDKNGYGPNGKDYLAHVEIPKDVTVVFEYLKKLRPKSVRGANPAFATKK